MKMASPMMRLAGVLVGAALLNGASGDIAGTWNTAPKPYNPPRKIEYEPRFDFKVDGDKLTGVVYTAGWPYNGTISDGKVEGDRITFTLTHEGTYSIFDKNGKTTFQATYRCAGTVHGDELDLTMSSPNPGLGGYDMKGTRAHE
jgi:hypothetical protein